jgi:hypothetical protein
MALARCLASPATCIQCLAGWLWQGDLGAASRELRQLVRAHRCAWSRNPGRMPAPRALGAISDCALELPWLERNFQREVALHLGAIAQRHLQLGWRSVVGYVSDFLQGFVGVWLPRLLLATAAAEGTLSAHGQGLPRGARRELCFEHLWLRNELFRKQMRGPFDVDAFPAADFELYAQRGDCCRFAGFCYEGWCPSSPRNGDVLLYMEGQSATGEGL